jgi:hypothetical protein
MLAERRGTARGPASRRSPAPAPQRPRQICSRRGVWRSKMALAQAPSLGLAVRSQSFATSTLEDFRIVTNVNADDVPEALRRDCVLFYAPDCKELAERIADASHGAVRLGNIRWKCVAGAGRAGRGRGAAAAAGRAGEAAARGARRAAAAAAACRPCRAAGAGRPRQRSTPPAAAASRPPSHSSCHAPHPRPPSRAPLPPTPTPHPNPPPPPPATPAPPPGTSPTAFRTSSSTTRPRSATATSASWRRSTTLRSSLSRCGGGGGDFGGRGRLSRGVLPRRAAAAAVAAQVLSKAVATAARRAGARSAVPILDRS